jgi:hypothetical protein
VLILRGSIKDGEIARVELEGSNHLVVLPNHSAGSEGSDDGFDEEMSDIADELDGESGDAEDMDLYEQ